MQFYAVVLAAMAAAVSAQFPTNIDPAQQSALLALATALPPSVLAAAATNQAGFASEVASSIAAGNTPEWYQALPTDVKSALASIYPVSTSAEATPSETAAPSSSSYEASSVAETTAAVTSTPVVVPSGTGASSIGTNSTGVTSVNTPTLSGTGSPQPTEAPGAASVPSAAIGAGIAGALAFLGMLAL
ncbi:uncharacterized protein CC84DRAFT_1171464 [Paraphaeosphaeria sporulosa]|uniref:Uncharacterized protein n=1 Tax=Paraphaeosphaeria sporulosa TaxID=1460663 RepID=A0A177D0P3_9PLEO|nr:uncharacterized protein CC84DRAFT_1171464 [Paraphaeosphaeria sporulosa]OAG12797.1 hypothetical protein CC84DRAFT_1171464 [Paraphaeosphaeria sporulosa]